MRFENTQILLALVIIPVLIFLFILLLKWKKNTARKIGEPRLIETLTRNYSQKHFILKFIIALFALAFTIVGAANLQKPGKSENIRRTGLDIMFVLDVSKSMLAQDYKPNRLERAKQLMIKLMDKLPDDKIGLVLFAGRAYLQMPLTTDHGAAKMLIQNAGPASVPVQGTVISDALKMANSGFNTEEKSFKSVVLITDGEDHDASAGEVAASLFKNGVMINTIGIGSAEGAIIIDPETGSTKKDEQGNIVISKLNENLLQQLAAKTRGTYVKLEDADETANKIVAQLNTIDQKSLKDLAYVNYKNYFQLFAGAGLILLVTELFIAERKKSLV